MSDQMELMDGQPNEELGHEEYVLDGSMVDPHEMPHGYIEEEEVHCQEDPDEYGGMDNHIYDAIVEFKRSGVYPAMADQRVDRSAHCHWRLRCNRFSMDDDNMTLLYGGEAAPVEMHKYVIRKGEVKDVIDRVHSLVGHLGTKRTQAAIMKKLYWRSVRNDVKTFINNCGFCIDKKHQGKKLAKAPVDTQSESFDLDITMCYEQDGTRTISINLAGFDEDYVRAAAHARMTTYTFRTTGAENRKRYSNPQLFKRQPYLRRSRYNASQHESFLVPVMSHDSREPTYMAMPASRVEEIAGMTVAKEPAYRDDEDEEISPVDPSVATTNPAPTGPRILPLRRRAKVYDLNHAGYRRSKKLVQPGDTGPQVNVHGAAARLSSIMTQSALRDESVPSTSGEKLSGVYNTSGIVSHDVITAYEDARDRPEMTLLPAIVLMPSNDPEVVMLQKEMIQRQIELQKMQHRVLQSHLDAARYEEVVVDGREDVEELNVIDGEGF